MSHSLVDISTHDRVASTPAVPAYLRDTDTRACLTPTSLAVFDHPLVVDMILWGQHDHLERLVLDEMRPGQRVLQAACVYGEFSTYLAKFLGPDGRLDIVDIAPIQAENSRRKLTPMANTRVRIADAADPGGGDYNTVVSFLLIHEVPDDYKRRLINGLLARIGKKRAGGVYRLSQTGLVAPAEASHECHIRRCRTVF